MTKILVTGAGGQLGGHVVRRAQEAGLQVRGVGSAELDITDPEAVGRFVEKGSVVVNCAAYTAVDAAETDEQAAAAVNGHGPAHLAAACARTGARLLHVSTDYVFAGDADTPYEVDAPTAPATAYGRTKLAGEQAVHAALPSAHIVRTAWVYTGSDFVSTGRSGSDFVSTGRSGSDFVSTMLRLERERDTVDVVTDQVGSPTFAVDLADALLELASRPDVVAPVLHATNSGQATWFDLARAVFEEAGADPERVRPSTSAQFVRPAPRPAYSVLSGKVWEQAGLTPLRPWREALRAALHVAV